MATGKGPTYAAEWEVALPPVPVQAGDRRCVNLEAVAPPRRGGQAHLEPLGADAHWGLGAGYPGHVLRCSLPLDVMTTYCQREPGPQSASNPALEVKPKPPALG